MNEEEKGRLTLTFGRRVVVVLHAMPTPAFNLEFRVSIIKLLPYCINYSEQEKIVGTFCMVGISVDLL